MKTVYQPNEHLYSDIDRILVTVHYELMKPKKATSKASVAIIMKKIDKVVDDANIEQKQVRMEVLLIFYHLS